MNKSKEEIVKIVEDYEAKLREEEGGIVIKLMNPDTEPLIVTDLKAFLTDVILRNNLKALYGDTKQIQSFSNEKTGGNQCYVGAMRSIGDLFRMAIQHYNKETTLLEVMQAMYEIVNSREPVFIAESPAYNGGIIKTPYQIYTAVCGGMARRKFFIYNPKSLPASSSYRFEANSQTYKVTSDYTHNEFPIVMQDYLTLFETADIETELVTV